jgi:hypothetical protein
MKTVLAAGGVKVLVLLGLDVRHLDLIDRAQSLVNECAIVHVPELGLDHGPEVAGSVVGEVDNDVVHSIHGNDHSPAYICGFQQHGSLRLSPSLCSSPG